MSSEESKPSESAPLLNRGYEDYIEVGEQLEGLISWLIDDPCLFIENIEPPSALEFIPPPKIVDGVVEYVTLSLNQLGRMIAANFGQPNWYVLKRFFTSTLNDQYIERFYGHPDVLVRLRRKALEEYRESNSLAAMLLGKHYFVPKMRKSVAEVQVRSSRGDVYTGSAFAVRDAHRGAHLFFLSCRHNILEEDGRPYRGIELYVEGRLIPLDGMATFDRLDACLLLCRDDPDVERLGWSYFSTSENVITAGYPRTHHMRRSPLLFLEGMVNGLMEPEGLDYSIIMSCSVAPGNSGGPVLNSLGSAIGMVHRSIETSSIGGVSNFGTAIPMSLIVEEWRERRFTSVDVPA